MCDNTILKICSKCKIPKDKNKDFYTPKRYICKICELIWMKNYKNKRKDLKTVKDSRKRTNRKYYILNKEKIAIQVKNYQSGTQKYKDGRKKYRAENKDKIKKTIKEWSKKGYYNKLNTKLYRVLGSRIRNAIKSHGGGKKLKTEYLVGCSTEYLKNYLESKFLPTMSWENYGKLWHIDHIKPCSSFDLTNEEEQLKCFHYSNLRPLFAVTKIINNITYIGNLNRSKYDDNL